MDRVPTSAGEMLLVLTGPAGQSALAAATLPTQVLDADASGATYTWVYPAPGRERPPWPAASRVLYDDGIQVLLRGAPALVEPLAAAGGELRRLPLTPMVLRPGPDTVTIPGDINPDPAIQAMIDDVDGNTVYQYDGDLSGEWPVMVGGGAYTIDTRHTYSGVPVQKATQYVGEHLAGLGMGVEYHVWQSGRPPNVIGEITGETNPDEIYIVSAHLDSTSNDPYNDAPGADDNASGSVAALIAADIFSQHRWGCTLRFTFWTGEEQGLLGSFAYAQRAYQNGENIAGVLNLDMIAWNTPNSSPDIDLHANSSLPQTLTLAQLFADVVDTYGMNLVPQIISSGTGASDHASFWYYGYTAILGIEDYYGTGDFNPYYHTTNDTLNHLEMAYFTDFVKASVGTAAHMAGCLIPDETGTLAGQVTAAADGAPVADALVAMEDAAGVVVTATTGMTGTYASTLPAGTYTVTAAASGYLSETVGGVTVITDTVTTQDFALASALAAPEIHGVATTIDACVVDFDPDYSGDPPLAWQWHFSSGTPMTSTLESPAGIDFGASGTYPYTATVSNPAGGDTYTDTISVSCDTCNPITGVDFVRVTTGTVHVSETISLHGRVFPAAATMPFTYSIAVDGSLVITSQISLTSTLLFDTTFTGTGVHTVTLSAWNCGITEPVTDTVYVLVLAPGEEPYPGYLPVIFNE